MPPNILEQRENRIHGESDNANGFYFIYALNADRFFAKGYEFPFVKGCPKVMD